MGEDPARYGLEPPETLHPTYQFEEAEVPDATSLDVVARAAGVEESTIDRLNPHLLRRVTPRGRATVVRLPVGTGETFAAAYALIPPDERVTVTDHVVSSGETLSEIALYYGIRVAELEAANPDVEPRRMQIGQRLLVPLVPGSGRVAAAPSAVPRPRDGIHVVSRGESLWTIARRYGVTLSELRSLNGLGSEPVLQPGDRLRLPTGG